MGHSNCTICLGAGGLCGSYGLWGLFSVTGIILLLSLIGNIFCCLKQKKEKNGKFFQHFRRSFNTIEENPVYGNISFLQSAGRRLGDKKIIQRESTEHWQSQMNSEKPVCYANMNKRKPLIFSEEVDSGIQYTDVVTVVKRKPERGIWGDGSETWNKTTAPYRQGTELYACVDSQQYKTLFENQDYANKQPTDI